MKVQPAAFLRTSLPLDLSRLDDLDSGRYHSIWLPDHMVSFWPDSIWTPEFTDLASVSPSPHRHLDGLAVASAAAVLTHNVPLVSAVVDTVRRHPAMLAQTALTIDHLSRGRFILGLGSGETENTVPYGFDFANPVSRFEEAIKVIKLLWERDGTIVREPVRLQRVRALIAEPTDGASVPAGEFVVRGVAWSGAAPIDRVDVSISEGPWQRARLIGERRRHSWQWWELLTRCDVRGPRTVRARATDQAGRTQPEQPEWNRLGYGGNAIQTISIVVE